MRRLFFVISILILTACQNVRLVNSPTKSIELSLTSTIDTPSRIESRQSPSSVISNTPIIKQLISATLTTTTNKPSSTPKPNFLFISETPSATYDWMSVVTFTPAPPAQCPKIDPTLQPIFLETMTDPFAQVGQPILDYLNMGGSKESVLRAFLGFVEEKEDDSFFEKDVTGDGVSELFINYISIYIFGCEAGKYSIIFQLDPEAELIEPIILKSKDLNGNGIPEIPIYYGDSCGMNSCGGLALIEWTGEKFVGLFENDPEYDFLEFINMDAAFTTEFRDIDLNGTIEIILHSNLPVWVVYRDGFPWRVKHDTYMWNGIRFVIYKTEYANPEFRFQAIQDADLYALYGEFDRAQKLYQDAIFNDKLDWWSPDRQKIFQDQWYAKQEGSPTPTLGAPDPKEYLYLASYARFKIMVLHLLRGWIPEAEVVYRTLQEKFLEGQSGHEFADMADKFWIEFQASNSIGLACLKAIDYARENQGILRYLGSDFHGWQSHTYDPEDVCVFK
jgi:hypothetical protein